MEGIKTQKRFFDNRLAVVGIILISLLILFSFSVKGFFSSMNLNNLLQQITMIGIVTVGQTFVIVCGCIDLSQASVLGLTTVWSALLVSGDHLGLPWWVAIFSCIGISIAISVINGFLASYVKLPAFIATLGMMQITQALALLSTGGSNIHNLPPELSAFAKTSIGGVFPVMVIFTIVFAVVGHLVLSRTTYGRAIYATGSNANSAKFSGIKTERTRFTTYLISGLTVGVAGFIMLCKVNGGIAKAGTGYEMNAIAGAVIGGGSLDGGLGSITGSMIGAGIMIVLTNGLQVAGISSYIQQLIMGAILITAVYVDMVRRHKEQ